MSLISFRTVVGALVVSTALTACGGPVKAGAAATFGGGRITTASLDQTAIDWKKQYDKNPAADQTRQSIAAQATGGSSIDANSPPRNALTQLIDFRIWDEVARQQKVTVTPTQVDALIAASGGQAKLDILTLAVGLPSNYSRDYARSFAIRQTVQRAILQASGVTSQSTSTSPEVQRAQKAYVLIYLGAVKALNMKINPRYGKFNLATMALGKVEYSLSRTETGLTGA
ncbi:MAG TPA: hypothetical protein VNW94_06840 [Streptosporangiaceae bacterium]|nr:hypothetical protein [Streptosporangiaceae bacterium]